MTIWYMRDNHTFIPLPLDADEAMARLRRAFIDEIDAYGMLCTTEGPMRGKYEHAAKDWSEFEPRARKWLDAALLPSGGELEAG